MKILVLAEKGLPQLELLSKLPPGFEITIEPDPSQLGPQLAEIQSCLICLASGYRDKLDYMITHRPKLRWAHIWWTGVDNLITPALQRSQVTLTNARGAYATPLAEFVIGACLYFEKDFARQVRSQQKRIWDRFEGGLLEGKTLGIFGYGEIGRCIAKKASGLGMRVIATRRRPETHPSYPYLSQIIPLAEVGQLFAEADFLVSAAPLTADAAGFIDRQLLDKMKPSAIFLNVGRGPVVNESDLITALQTKRIKGAALDVYQVEPLPENSPLWEMDNVFLSAHCADRYPGWNDRPVVMFVENCWRLARGEELSCQVDLELGY